MRCETEDQAIHRFRRPYSSKEVERGGGYHRMPNSTVDEPSSCGGLCDQPAEMDRPEGLLLQQTNIALLGQLEASAEDRRPGRGQTERFLRRIKGSVGRRLLRQEVAQLFAVSPL